MGHMMRQSLSMARASTCLHAGDFHHTTIWTFDRLRFAWLYRLGRLGAAGSGNCALATAGGVIRSWDSAAPLCGVSRNGHWLGSQLLPLGSARPPSRVDGRQAPCLGRPPSRTSAQRLRLRRAKPFSILRIYRQYFAGNAVCLHDQSDIRSVAALKCRDRCRGHHRCSSSFHRLPQRLKKLLPANGPTDRLFTYCIGENVMFNGNDHGGKDHPAPKPEEKPAEPAKVTPEESGKPVPSQPAR